MQVSDFAWTPSKSVKLRRGLPIKLRSTVLRMRIGLVMDWERKYETGRRLALTAF